MVRFWAWLKSLFHRKPKVVLYDIVLEVAGSWVQYKREVLLEGIDLRFASTFLREIVGDGDEDSSLPGELFIDNIRDRFARIDPDALLIGATEYCDIYAIPVGTKDPRAYDCTCHACRVFFEDVIG